MKIAIASGKGGTGKTLLSVNLASYLSNKQPVVLVDLDVEEPNDLLFFNGQPDVCEDAYKKTPKWDESTCTLCGACSEFCNFHAVLALGKSVVVFDKLCHSCHACSELCPEGALHMKKMKTGEIRRFPHGNLTLIEGRLATGEEQSAPLIRQVHQFVEQHFQDPETLIIMDSPPGTSCPVIAAVKEADLVLLVTEPTPFGLNDLILAAETLKQLGKPAAVIINRAGIGNIDTEAYCANEKLPVISIIPYDKDIALMYSDGHLMYKKHQALRQALEDIHMYINQFQQQ